MGLNLSIRNGNEIAKKAPEYMDNNNFILIECCNFKPHILYGGIVEYYATYDNMVSDTFMITLVMINDSIVVYNITEQKKGE